MVMLQAASGKLTMIALPPLHDDLGGIGDSTAPFTVLIFSKSYLPFG